MKEIEELFRKLRHHYRLFLKGSNDSFIKMNEIETDLLSRFRELEEELSKYVKAFSTLWNYYKEIDKERISLSIRAEQAEEQVERLRCCGNCKHYEYDMEEDHYYCSKNISHGKRHAGICSSNWTFERK